MILLRCSTVDMLKAPKGVIPGVKPIVLLEKYVTLQEN
jgi:hypothetical protein